MIGIEGTMESMSQWVEVGKMRRGKGTRGSLKRGVRLAGRKSVRWVQKAWDWGWDDSQSRERGLRLGGKEGRDGVRVEKKWVRANVVKVQQARLD